MAVGLTRTALFAGAMLALCACDSAETGAPVAPPHVLVRAAGDWQQGMGLETLREPLTVRAIDPVTSKPVPRLRVRFAVDRAHAGGATLSDSVAITNDDGIARTLLTLGKGAVDTVFVIASADGGPSERFATLVSPAPQIRSVVPANIRGGDTVRVIGSGLGFATGGSVRFNGVPSRVVSAGDTIVKTIAPACIPSGSVSITVTNGGARTDTISAVYETSAAPLSLAPLNGVVLTASQLTDCVQLRGGGAQYLIIVQVESDAPGPDEVDVEIGAQSAATAAALTRGPIAAEPVPTAQRFETLLRRREKSYSAFQPLSLLRAPSRLPALNSIDSFRVISKIDASQFATVTAQLRYFGKNIFVWVDTTSNPDLQDGQLQALSRLFDEELYPLDENFFGEASDVDGNGRVNVVLTPVVNTLTAAGQCTLSGFVGGFFTAHDLYPTIPNANGGEFFYGFVPDSAGRWGCPHSTGEFSRVIRTAFVHELQHVINYEQHVFRRSGKEEDVWLNEGMSHIAEELASKYYERRFPAPTGRSIPGQLFPDSSQSFIVFNLINAYLFLRQPYFTSVTHFIEAGTIEERGAAWLFLRWIADQYGEDILRRIVQTSLTGKANIADKTGEPFSQLLGQFMIATYTDSLPGLPRTAVPSRFRFQSRNLRELFQRLNTTANFDPFPTVPLVLPYDGKASGPLRIGGAAFLLLDVPADKTGTTLRFTPLDGSPWAPGLQPQVSIFRLK